MMDLNLNILMINPSALAIFGYESVEEALGLSAFKFVAEEDYEEVLKIKDHLLKAGSLRSIMLKLFRNDGKAFNSEVSCSLINDTTNTPKSILLVIRDVTERMRVEEEIKQKNQALTEINREKDKIFSIIAHDLRSPFQGFLSVTEVIVEDFDSFSNEERLRLLKRMHSSATNVYKLLSNLLTWGQVQRGTIKFAPTVIDLCALIKQIVEILSRTAETKNIEIKASGCGNIKVYADEAMLNSIISNLLSNAIKFTNDLGHIEIAVESDGEGVKVSVKDSGIGIPSVMLSKLFKLGEKIGRKGTRDEESTGLGLILCHEFVNRHGGKIWAESEENQGTTFTFTLPRTHIPTEPQEN